MPLNLLSKDVLTCLFRRDCPSSPSKLLFVCSLPSLAEKEKPHCIDMGVQAGEYHKLVDLHSSRCIYLLRLALSSVSNSTLYLKITNKAANENHLKQILCSVCSVASEPHQAAVFLLLLHSIFHNLPQIKFLKDIVCLE